jgi:hypothetical protein
MEKAGGTDTDKVIAALEALKYDIAKGPQHYRKCDHQSVQSVLVLESKKKAEMKNEADSSRCSPRSPPRKPFCAAARNWASRPEHRRHTRHGGSVMDAELIAMQLFSGVALGAILIMVALGLSIIFGMLGVVNFAHGALFAIGPMPGSGSRR